ncbi:MAG: glyoxylate/hydroxypyruvate reductase A [Pseudomonadota bacterium]
MTKILWAASDEVWSKFEAPLRREIAAQMPEAELVVGPHDPAEIEYMVYAPNGPVKSFDDYTRLKLVQNIWAGVDLILANPDKPNCPVARMADTGMAEGMSDYVLGHVLRHHLQTDYFASMSPGEWFHDDPPPLARDRKVAILGLGNLGIYCGQRIASQGFEVHGWSRSEKHVEGIKTYAGDQGFLDILGKAEIFVLLLPNTPQTQNIINADTLARMPKGASIINAGRGDAIVDADLISALTSGHISQATLDVFRQEPLPKDDPYWTTPNVLITPHVAAETRASTACIFALQNFVRGEKGEPFLALVDMEKGY